MIDECLGDYKAFSGVGSFCEAAQGMQTLCGIEKRPDSPGRL